jgi:uncharacterized protein DUF6997/uncharacterized protein DUF6996
LSINKSQKSSSNSKPIRKKEKWSDVINKLNMDISKPVNYITAGQIKQISNEEPRLMAKMDRLEDCPKVFRDNNLFLLPVSRREYAIVKGVGYHQLESIGEEEQITHYAQIPFPESFANFESEQVYLNYAYSTGLIERFAQIPLPNPPSQIRVNTPEFNVNIDNCNIHVNRAQIEIDAITESLKTIVIIEAKIGMPGSFNIRQMYYPFRTFHDKKKKVRSFFFCVEPKQSLYMFWEYGFNPYSSLESISLIHCRQYKILVSNVPSIKQFTDVQARKDLIIIPQADDVNKIIQFPLRVYEGHDTSGKIESIFDFTNRQSSYYRHASEIFGSSGK